MIKGPNCSGLKLCLLHRIIHICVVYFLTLRIFDQLRAKQFTQVFDIRWQDHGLVMSHPVVKVPISVMNVDGRLHISGSQQVNSGDNSNGSSSGPPPPPSGPNSAQLMHDGRQLFIYMKSMHSDLNGKIDLVAAAQAANKLWMTQQFNRVVDNQRRFGGTIQQALSRQCPRQNALHQETCYS